MKNPSSTVQNPNRDGERRTRKREREKEKELQHQAPTAEINSRKKKPKVNAAEIPTTESSHPEIIMSSKAPRVWTDDDAKTLLTCVGEFRSNTGDTPKAATIATFLECFQPSLPDGVRGSQILGKLNHMKKNYRKIVRNGRPQDHRFFNHYVEAWGQMTINDADGKEEKEEEEEGGPTSSQYPIFSQKLADYFQKKNLSMELLHQRLASIGSGKAKSLENKWKNHTAKVLELHIKAEELNSEARKLFLKGFRLNIE